MRVWLAASAVMSALSVVGQATGVPPWMVLAGTILGGGGFLGRWMYLRLEQKFEARLQSATASVQEATAEQTKANTASAVEELQRSLIERARAVNSEMQVELEQVKARLAESNERAAKAESAALSKDAEIANLHVKIRVLSGRIESLHDELSALRFGEEFGKRRLDDEPTEQ